MIAGDLNTDLSRVNSGNTISLKAFVDKENLFFGLDKFTSRIPYTLFFLGPEAGGNKLRTYRKFKQHYRTEPNVNIIIAKKHRSAYAKFRCGVAPIKIETCRYGLNRLSVEQRVCEECQVVEDECHVIMHCTL